MHRVLLPSDTMGPMQINSQQTYAATPDEVFAMMTDQAYLAACCDRFGAKERTIDVNGNTTTVKMKLPAPAQVQKFIGAVLPLNQIITWGEAAADGSRHGTLAMTVDKMPVNVTGTAVLRPGGQGTEVIYDADMVVKIPLVGKKLEQEAAPVAKRALDAQEQVGQDYLANKA